MSFGDLKICQIYTTNQITIHKLYHKLKAHVMAPFELMLTVQIYIHAKTNPICTLHTNKIDQIKRGCGQSSRY